MTPDFMESLLSLSRLDDGPRQAGRLLAKNGIATVFLHHLPGTHLDGAAMLRADGHPVVALTLRHDCLDNFWFTLAHELAHIVLHLAKGDTTAFLDDLDAEAGKCDAKEKEADKCVSEILLPNGNLRTSQILKSPTPEKIRELALRNHVHPAIVAGRIRYERHNYKILTQWVGVRAVRKRFPAYKAGDIS